jgi:hypothetical protein
VGENGGRSTTDNRGEVLAAPVAHEREESEKRERKKGSRGLNFSPVMSTELARLLDM